MLADAPRTLAYRAGLARGGALRGARVLDLGCGTGILSLFAADEGARAVVALDASTVADDAAAVVRANGKAGAVAVVWGRAEGVPLERVRAAGEAAPADARAPAGGGGFAVLEGALAPAADEGAPANRRVFDAIVSEWMG